jgi:exodeoxyribonuclease VII large subunit
VPQTFLQVPFSEKNEAKTLGARWDSGQKQWFVPDNLDVALFARWIPECKSIPKAEKLEGQLKPFAPQNESEITQLGISLAELMSRISTAISKGITGNLWVKAEISQLRTIKGDHLAIELVEHDDVGNLSARVQSFLWKGKSKTLIGKFKSATGSELVAGIKVMLSVRIDFSAISGVRLIIEDIDPTYTLGDIEAKLRQIRESLSMEGVVGRNKQIPIPLEFCHVAVISPDGAAGLGDFKRDADILANAGLCQFEYLSARFQGSDAAQNIKDRLQSVMDSHSKGTAQYDAICIIRGGGSVTDLYWLNDLELARTVCHCPLPIFTGIGHERDNTILDEIANQRFDTPSKVIGHIRDLICQNAQTTSVHFQMIMLRSQQSVTHADNQVVQLFAELHPSVLRLLSEAELKLDQGMQWIESRVDLVLSNAESQVSQYRERILSDADRWLSLSENDADQVYQAVFQHGQQEIALAIHQVEALGREILGMGPQATLRRGFAIVRTQNGLPIVSAGQAENEQLLKVEFRDGNIAVKPLHQTEIHHD